jgi:hypothetical protein
MREQRTDFELNMKCYKLSFEELLKLKKEKVK